MTASWTCGRTCLVWLLRERNFCSGRCRVRHHRSRTYSKPSRSKPPSGNIALLPVSAPESQTLSIELRSPGRSLRTAMANARRLPTTTTSLLPLVIAVYSRLRCSIG